MKAEVLKDHVDGLLLVALEDGPRHGYAVIEALRTQTRGRIDLPRGSDSNRVRAAAARHEA